MTGFRRALIAPKPENSLQWAHARYRSAAGFYESGWCLDEAEHLIIDITIPFNAAARVVLPDAKLGEIIIDGQPFYDGMQIGKNVELALRAGRHKIEYMFGEQEIHAGLEASSPHSL